MDTRVLDGNLYKKLLVAGLQQLRANAETINDLNVFPISDGDTGDNMCATLNGGIKALNGTQNPSLDYVASSTAKGMFLGARGNSGVIFSQFFAGVAEGFAGVESANVSTVISAFRKGVQSAYKSVGKPVEGTILTVLREATERTAQEVDGDAPLKEFFSHYLVASRQSLDNTPELLPVLKEAGVVDSGGAGVMHVIEGFVDELSGGHAEYVQSEVATPQVDLSKFNEDSVMKYGYCTEFLLQLQHAKTSISNFQLNNLTARLEKLGDSIVALVTGSIVKIHIHTFTPGLVLETCREYGEFLTMKMENMTLQHNETLVKKEKKTPKYKYNKVRKQYGVVTVANGSGLHQMFKQVGADIVIDGGQGHNPSVEDFIDAYEAVNADVIFVLPNNDNIAFAANQTKDIYTSSNIIIIPSRSIGDGYCALSMLDLSCDDANTIASNMKKDIDDSQTGLISAAIRDATVDGVKIVCGDYMGFTAKKMLLSAADKLTAATNLLSVLHAEDKSFLVVFYGKDASEKEREALQAQVAASYPQLEYYGMDGEQEVYDFIIVLQ